MRITAPDGYKFFEADDETDTARFGLPAGAAHVAASIRPPGGRQVYGGSRIDGMHAADGSYWLVCTGPTPTGFRPWAMRIAPDGSQQVIDLPTLREHVGANASFSPIQTAVLQFISEREIEVADLPGYTHWYTGVIDVPDGDGAGGAGDARIADLQRQIAALQSQLAGVQAQLSQLRLEMTDEIQTIWQNMVDRDHRIESLRGAVTGGGITEHRAWQLSRDAVYHDIMQQGGIAGAIIRLIDERIAGR